MSRRRAFAVLMSLALLAGCGEKPAVTLHESPPERLSAWGLVLSEGDRLVLNERVLPYELNTPLFSDYAQKLRTVWMPRGRAARYRATGDWAFPVGTVLTKTFYYPVAGPGEVYAEAPRSLFDGAALTLDGVRLIETRLLVKQAGGWEAYPYVWNEAQTEATLRRVGDMVALRLAADGGAGRAFTYVVPDANQCAGCHRPDHSSRELRPLGPKTRHLNVATLRNESINPFTSLTRTRQTHVAMFPGWPFLTFVLQQLKGTYENGSCLVRLDDIVDVTKRSGPIGLHIFLVVFLG